MAEITVVIPFFQGHQYLEKLVKGLADTLPVIVVDDVSDPPLEPQEWMGSQVTIIRLKEKSYFSGAVNVGILACDTDVLVLNQDTWFENSLWLETLEQNRDRYALIGERISGNHPAFQDLGYIHGTFMYIRRDAISRVGLLNGRDYPLWGSTAEYQWRVTRSGFEVLPLRTIPGFHHERPSDERYGSSIKELLDKTPTGQKSALVVTPPLLSVVVPCYNYGRYLQDCISSLIGGPSSLGWVKPQTLQSFEVLIVDDASTDDSWEYIKQVTDISKGIRSYRLEKNVGTAKALNFAIERAVGRYVTFLSADDMREPESLEALVRCCQANPHSFAYDDICLFYKDRKIKNWEMEEYDFDRTLHKNQVHAGIVFPKVAWEETGGYPPMMNDGREDWAFNVALGIKGWCGEHVHQFGYLYRRENQNRSMTNTSPEHHERFKRKISSIFPDVYRGERPFMCCGRGTVQTRTSPAVRSLTAVAAKRSTTMNLTSGGMMASSTGSEGMVSITYLGQGMTSVWDGPVTNTRYRFGKDSPGPKWVDKRDAGEQGKGGFLGLKDTKGNYVFQLVDSQPAQEATEAPEPTGDVLVTVSNPQASPEPAVEPESEPVVDSNVVPEDQVDPQQGMDLVKAEATVDFPDPTPMTVTEVKALDLTLAQWREVYKAEAAGNNRKGIQTFIEEKLAAVE